MKDIKIIYFDNKKYRAKYERNYYSVPTILAKAFEIKTIVAHKYLLFLFLDFQDSFVFWTLSIYLSFEETCRERYYLDAYPIRLNLFVLHFCVSLNC